MDRGEKEIRKKLHPHYIGQRILFKNNSGMDYVPSPDYDQICFYSLEYKPTPEQSSVLRINFDPNSQTLEFRFKSFIISNCANLCFKDQTILSTDSTIQMTAAAAV